MISVVVCTYNRDKHIYNCLSRLAANRRWQDFEILLIDNNSTDNTPAECERFVADIKPTNYRYLKETNQGLSFARNRGIKEAKGDWIVFLDDDAFVDGCYIDNLQKHIVQLPDMQAFGGKITPLFESGEVPEWLCRWNRLWVSAVDMGSKVKLFHGSKFPIGANMGFSKSLADKCGFFNTQLGRTGKNLISGEEKDYFRRIKSTGAKIYYLPDVAVSHCIPPQRTTSEYIRRLGWGIGQSERIRTLHTSRAAYFVQLLVETAKWGFVLLLWLVYTLRHKPVCANSLLIFRSCVTRGLLSKG